MLLKPRFGMRMWSGIWPPSKPKTETPERLFWPFWPRPAVLPMPVPTRTRLLRAPLLSRMSLSFMSLHSLSLLSRGGRANSSPFVIPAKAGISFPFLSFPKGKRESSFRWNDGGLLRHAHHMPHRADHAADLGAVLELRR